MAFDVPVGSLPRTIDWCVDHAVIIDQTHLPGELVMLEIRTVDEMIGAIQRLAVRGAPAIGVAGALGVAIAAVEAKRNGYDAAWLAEEANRLSVARPTAVNLSWAVGQLRPLLTGSTESIVEAAIQILNDDIRDGRALGERGADLVSELCGLSVRVQTHCNAGGLACVEVGSALGIVKVLHERGFIERVHLDETRPLLQGSRLTAYELAAMGIDYRIQVDGAGPSAIRLGLVDCVIIGADRVAANGDTANKVGSYPLALAAKRAGIPFIVAAPEATIDDSTLSGDQIHIEERSADEVLRFGGMQMAPNGAQVWNPAFDVTPFDLITAIVSEQRIIRP